jgi:hypothetical protein
MGQFGNQPDFATNNVRAITPSDTISLANNLNGSLIYIGDNTTTGSNMNVIVAGTSGGFGVQTLATVPPNQGVGTGYTTNAGPLATTTNGDGTGCTVSITAVAGAITDIKIIAVGLGYKAGDTVTVTQGGGADGTFTVTALKSLPPTAADAVLFRGLQTGGFLPVTVDYVLATGTTVEQLVAAQ